VNIIPAPSSITVLYPVGGEVDSANLEMEEIPPITTQHPPAVLESDEQQ
jgi:hypothetical protein